MTIIRLTLSSALAVLMGYLLITLILKDVRGGRSWCGLEICLSLGIGLGIASINFFIWLIIAPLANWLFALGEVLIVLGLLALYVRDRRNRKLRGTASPMHEENPTTLTLLAGAFYLCAMLAVIGFIAGHLWRPHGGWDAWAIWNLTARFLFRGGEHWKNAFSEILSHPDYPLLLPINVVRLWHYAGKETLRASGLVAFLFTFSTLGLLVASLTSFRGRSIGYLGGLALLGAPAFVVNAPTQCADIPLAFFMLAAVVLFCLHDRAPQQRRGFLLLAGIVAGLAVWTKNEGWLFLLSLLAARLLVRLLPKGGFDYLGELRDLGLGLFPVLLSVLFFKLTLAPPNDLAAGQGLQTFDRLADLYRYKQIGLEFIRQGIRFDPKSATPIAALLVILLLFGIKREQLKNQGLSTMMFILPIMFVGYFFVFLTTPHNLDWHLSAASFRLFLQLYPMIVFLVMMLLHAPRLEPPNTDLNVLTSSK